MSLKNRLRTMAAVPAAVIGSSGIALAAKPEPWQMGLQPPATEVMRRISDFHDLLLWFIIPIALFVLALLVILFVMFNEKSNPTPSKTTHNTLLEVVWTVFPVMILVVIAIPSFRLLYLEDTVPKADMTLKAIGHQWYWSYQYPDHGDFTFDSVMVPDDEIKAGQLRLLEVDNQIVVPVNTSVRLIVTADDVLHSWAVPSFGVKIDAVPGRLNETWFKAEREGVYYGQCSELCGVNHGFMPIAVKVVSKQAFDAWVTKAKQEFAADVPAGEQKLASNRITAR